MPTVSDIVTRVRIRLQDRDAANYAFPTDVLEEFIQEGLNKLSPVCGYRAEFDVNPGAGVQEFSLATYVGANLLGVEDITSDTVTYGWWVYGDTLYFEYAPNDDFTIRALVAYDAVTELPAALVDAVVHFTCSRALMWLLRRGGAAMRRYIAESGDLDPAELGRLSDMYKQDFLILREEHGVTSIRSL